MIEDSSLVMSEVSPAVAAMWRLIEILNSEKKLWQRQLLLRNETERIPRAPPRKKHLFLRSFSVDIPHTICDGNNNFSVRSDDCACFSAGETPCPIHEHIGCDTAMADSAARQGRVPPKNQDITAASPVVEIPASDHQGWLLDQLRGQRVWGSVSDGTLSLYETESTSVPKKAISLHSCRVKPIEFVSKLNQREHNGVVRHYGSNKASKVEKHQFLIENRNNKQNYVFGVASKQELDQWIIALNNASCEDFDSKLSEDTGISLDSSSASFESDLVKLRVGSDTSGMSAAPSPKLRPHSISFSNAQHVKRNSVVEILKRHRSTQGESEQKAQPVRVRHDGEDTGLVRPSRDAVRKSRSFLKNPFDNLFRRKKRSSSADDAFERRQQLSSEKTRSNYRFSDSLDSRVDIFQKRERQDSQDSTSSYSPETSPRYVDINYSTSVTSSLKRTASDLKSKLFGDSKDWDFTGVKLNQLQDIKVSGFLLYRQDFKYVKVFCALGHGWLYMFKTDRPEDTALLSIRLNYSCVQYVVELERRRKSLFAFKVSQPQCPSVYLLADDQQSLTKWIMSLQSEASSIQAEQRLADEIRAKKSVQKARVAQEIGMSPSDKNVSKQAELRLKRNSCPTFSLTDLSQVQGDTLRRTSDISGIISSDKGTLYKGDKSVLPLETKKLTGLSPDIYDENYTSSHFKIAHLISPDSSTVSSCVDDINEVSDTSASLGLNSHIDLVAAEAETTHLSSWELKHHHKVVSDVKSRHVAYSPEVKHESERLLQKAAATVRRAASLNISDVKPATHPRISVFKPRVTSFFTPVQKRSPEETNADQLTSRNLLLNVNLIQDATKVATDTSTLSDYQTPSGNIESRYETKVSRNPSTDKEISNVEVSLSTESDSSFLSDSKKETSSSYSNQPEAAHQYRFDSNVHDSALKESWSTDQSFLLAVISDKLRQRRQCESQDTTSHCFNENVLVVHDDLPLNFTKKIPKMSSDETSESSDSETVTSFSAFLSSERKISSDVADCHAQMQGFVEKRGYDDKWIRYWCVLREACLYFYVRPDDKVSVDVTELTGYGVTELVDSFEGKSFVLKFDHKDYITVVISLDSNSEMCDWFQAIKAVLTSLKRGRAAGFSQMVANDSLNHEENVQQMSPSTRTVKEKLLAEMLRQKQELEKMQAARNYMKKTDTIMMRFSPTVGASPPATPPTVTDDNRICNLTRLRQRRMSAQLKLSVIKKQMEESQNSPRDKKSGFIIGRKKPDLVPTEVPGLKSDLEEQAKSLSSMLNELDSCITAHNPSTREADLHDRPILKKGTMYASDLSLQRSTHLLTEHKKDYLYSSNGDVSPKLTEKSTSLKSSVQKFAHKTFSRANRYLSRKSSSPSEEREDAKSSLSSPNNLSIMTPDVIDMTNSNGISISKPFSPDGSIYPDPPDNFKSDYSLLARTLPNSKKGIFSTKSHKNNLLSSSFSQMDLHGPRISPSSSFPSLHFTSDRTKEDFHQLSSSQRSFLKSESPIDSLDSSSSWSPIIPAKNTHSQASRREVNPQAMAQIYAFEELSKKFMQDCQVNQELL